MMHGVDTIVHIKTKGNNYTSIFRPYIHGKWNWVKGNGSRNILPADIVYTDTIFPAYKTVNSRPPWNDNWTSVTKVAFEKGTAYIKPFSFAQRGLLLLPRILFFMLLSYACWQLAFFLDNIQGGNVFSRSNYFKFRNIGLSIL